MPEKTSLTLLDEGAHWAGEAGVIAHWTDLGVPKGQTSIPRKMEEQSLKIKAEYLAWVHDLGQTSVNGESLVSFLKILDNLSYWWMTSIVIKSPFEGNSLHTVFKLRSLEKLYLEQDCFGLIYHGSNSILHRTLKSWCLNMGHPYQRLRTKRGVISKEKEARKWLRKLPYWVQALAYLIKNWYLRFRHIDSIKSEKAKQLQEEGGATIVTYFPNIDLEKTMRGEFWSRYWGSLHSVLERLPFKINWVWFYFESSGLKFQEAVGLRDICNKTNGKKNNYFLLDEFLTPRVFLQGLKLYFTIYRKGLSLKNIQRAFIFSGSRINFFPVMEKEWKASFFGNLAIEEAIRISMFDCMAKTLPAKPWGLFTWENLPWEFGLISAWRRHQKFTKILASQIGFFRIFDLRLYSDPRVFREKGNEGIPLPDKLCIYDNAGVSSVLATGFPDRKIAEVEALRYFSLKGYHSVYKKQLPPSGRTLLVIMGIKDRENQLQFELLGEAAAIGGLANYSKILVKPHPALSPTGLEVVYKSNLNLLIKKQSLDQLWPIVDVVYGANSTGASWEASWFGIPVIIVGAVNSLNLNPLLGLSGSHFITNGDELSVQLKTPNLVAVDEDFFFLDESLKLWKDLLQG